MNHTVSTPIPGLPPIPILGGRLSLLRFFSNPVPIMQRLHKEYGDIAAVSDGDNTFVCAFGAQYNQQLLPNAKTYYNFADLPFPLPPDSAAARFGINLTAQNGDTHRRQRRLMMPAFHKKIIDSYRDAMVMVADNYLTQWQNGDVKDMAEEMKNLTLAVMMRCLFGLEGGEEAHHFGKMNSDFLRYATSPAVMMFPVKLPGTPYSRFLQLCEALETRFKEMIQERRQRIEQGTDVFSILINTHDEDGTRLSDAELIGQTGLLFVAGHETTAFALTWTLFLISQHPTIYAELLDEVEGVLHGNAPTLAQLAELPLLDHVVKESMRLLPPTPFLFIRHATTTFSLGPYQLPAGAKVVLSPLITHRADPIYANAKQFDPHRWQTIKPSAFEYLPFGAGPRMCIGAGFAALEIRLVLAMIVQRFRLRLVDNTAVSYKVQGITMGPKEALPMSIHNQDRHFSPATPIQGTIHELVNLT